MKQKNTKIVKFNEIYTERKREHYLIILMNWITLLLITATVKISTYVSSVICNSYCYYDQ